MQPASAPRVEPFGDSAILVTFGEAIDPDLNAQVHALAAAVRPLATDPGTPFGIPVPGYSSLLIPYDPAQATYAEALALLQPLLVATTATRNTQHATHNTPDPDAITDLPVRYGGESGPDLAEVAAACGLDEAGVVALHSGALYRVFMLGFAPGFAYLGPLPAPLVLPRRATPRPRVPAGSVAIAGGQTGIYPLATPGGWHLIGHTAAPLWDVTRTPPALLRPGGWVRFVLV
jgi:KipI family sensor histidine kinase inhibitor